MSSLTISGDTSGQITIEAPAVSGTNTQTLVAATGTLAPLISGTVQASTSGTSIDFTGIPSWVKRVTVMFNGVSLSGSATILVQIGSGSVSTSGFTSNGAYSGTSNQAGGVTSTAGFVIFAGTASNVVAGTLSIYLLTATTYISSHVFAMTQGASLYSLQGGGTSPSLSGALDRVRITTTNGTDTFDAGSINIMYE